LLQVISYTDLKADEILHVLDEESKDPRTDVDMFAGEFIEIKYIKNLEIIEKLGTVIPPAEVLVWK
jgi:hypothetical protein